jgi:hypothetical protein
MQTGPGTLFPRVKWTTHLYLIPRSRKRDLYIHCPYTLACHIFRSVYKSNATPGVYIIAPTCRGDKFATVIIDTSLNYIYNVIQHSLMLIHIVQIIGSVDFDETATGHIFCSCSK